MEAQLDHSGEEEQHHHKSVLKKVKEKAKKIKNTIKKHGHGHDHDDEDDADEETLSDHEVHGAPMCESTVIRSANLPKEAHANLEKPTDTREDRYDDDARNKGTNRPFAPTGQTSLQMEKDNRNFGEPKTKTEPMLGLEEDPNSPENSPSSENIITPSNYQSKVDDTTRAGSKEAVVDPLVRRFDNLNVGDELASKTEPEKGSYTGSHDQFAPQPTPTKNQFNPESNTQETNPASGDSSTIAGNISSTTSAIADKALSTKNVVASKLGYGGIPAAAADSSKKPVLGSATEYAHIVYEKVAGAGSAVMSQVGGSGGASDGGGIEEHKGGDAVGVPAKGRVSMREYWAEKLRPGDEDKALSEAITGAFSKNKEAKGEKGDGRAWGGKVTVWKEVAERLGPVEESKREGEDAVAAGLESSGQGVVDRLRDAVSVWLGKSTGMQTAQDSVSKSHVSGVGAGTGKDFSGEKRD